MKKKDDSITPNYFACDPCECGGRHPDCPVCGVETMAREDEVKKQKRREALDELTRISQETEGGYR